MININNFIAITKNILSDRNKDNLFVPYLGAAEDKQNNVEPTVPALDDAAGSPRQDVL